MSAKNDIENVNRGGALTRRSLLTLLGTAGITALGLPVAEAVTKTTKKKATATERVKDFETSGLVMSGGLGLRGWGC